MLLHEELTRALREHPEARVSALRDSRSFAGLHLETDTKAAVLRRILPSYSRVLLMARNRPGYISTLLAIWRGGHLPILADPALSDPEVATLVGQCGIDAVIDENPVPGPQRPVVRTTEFDDQMWVHHTGVDADRPALAPDTELGRLTSGSTRTPACIEFSASAVLAAARGWTEVSELTSADVSLCFAGLYNGLAFNTTLIPNILAGADIVVPGVPPTAGVILRYTGATRPSILVAFPAAYERLSSYPPGDIAPQVRTALAAIRLRLSSAAPLAPEITDRVDQLSGPICDYYGIAETGPVTFRADPDDRRSLGTPIPGVSVRSGAGEASVLQVRTPSMGTTYLNYPGEFEAHLTDDGCYVTADVGEVVDGKVYLRGRAQPTLNIGGRKFGPEAIRAVIVDHPGVEDCHVVQVRTPTGRDCLGALIQAPHPIDQAALRRHMRAALADYKVPEVVVVVPRLPRGSAGKVKAAEARELVAAAFPDPASKAPS
ncbi:acyl--CoA ligase [Nocardia cyriacigeorgica]|uniref:Acyl--CoA ligase n=1 Tax=Nocardia cyriacigeorgica TaxID=135487 RepID=A0A6P1CUI0_9NOCA|nr:class I adenylate-forming enzyme family protein [Nocardia cyriacigeorgica]NEW35462.1 acyl--CoA ligase [Nocardia cyriacigeorgica]